MGCVQGLAASLPRRSKAGCNTALTLAEVAFSLRRMRRDGLATPSLASRGPPAIRSLSGPDDVAEKDRCQDTFELDDARALL